MYYLDYVSAELWLSWTLTTGTLSDVDIQATFYLLDSVPTSASDYNSSKIYLDSVISTFYNVSNNVSFELSNIVGNPMINCSDYVRLYSLFFL